MRRTVAIVVGLGVLLGLQTAGIAKEKRRPVTLDEAQIAAAVLAISDMPTGWSTVPPGLAQLPSATGGACGGPNEAARAQDAGVLGYKLVGFTADPNAGPQLYQGLFVFPSKKSAKAFVAANRALLTTCLTSQETLEGIPFNVAATEVSFPKMGDEVAALRFVLTGADPDVASITLTNDQFYIREGNFVIAIGQSSGGGLAAAPADPTLNETYADLALERLGTAIQAAKQQAKKSK